MQPRGLYKDCLLISNYSSKCGSEYHIAFTVHSTKGLPVRRVNNERKQRLQCLADKAL